MKQTIRLTESQFKKVITETIKKVLKEDNELDYGKRINVDGMHVNDAIYTIKKTDPNVKFSTISDIVVNQTKHYLCVTYFTDDKLFGYEFTAKGGLAVGVAYETDWDNLPKSMIKDYDLERQGWDRP